MVDLLNTELEEIYGMFLSSITDYSIPLMSNDDFEEEMLVLLKKSIARFRFKKDIAIDELMGEFTRELTDEEKNILALGMVSEWVKPKIYSVEVMKMKMNSKDYQLFSESNHIDKLRNIKKEADAEFDYYMDIYSLDTTLEKLVK